MAIKTMNSSYFFLQAEKNTSNSDFINAVEDYSETRKKQFYLIDRPLGDSKYSYEDTNHLIVLTPSTKILLINFDSSNDSFREFCEDFLEDLAAIADKYRYKDIIGRSREWKNNLIAEYTYKNQISDLNTFISGYSVTESKLKRNIELLISLLTGSINDVEKVKADIPNNILDKIKQKIVIFDGDQTRFIYTKPQKKRILIQGLSGTGKTELLLHKLRDLYTASKENRIIFTCHNKILADKLRSRIPEFFDFMKVEEQIQWEKRLWCVHAWGSHAQANSGAYRYICNYYEIPFLSWSRSQSFDYVCRQALSALTEAKRDGRGYAFDYMLIDESQDFPESFFELCEMVTKESVYIAGDIFQSIFDVAIISDINPDYLLSKCYRTDPRTLMFAHAIGMGLFESPKIRWLEEKEWSACGYLVNYNEEHTKITLAREPLSRFEDLEQEGIPSVSIVRTGMNGNENEVVAIIKILKEIKQSNQTVLPSDVGIIFIDSDKQMYTTADNLERAIPQAIGWKINKAYETKQASQDAIFISNRNHVKGLEFPFVICVTRRITSSLNYRNSLYMMLTRSFIQSYLLVSGKLNEPSFLQCIEKGLNTINSTGSLPVSVPSEEEKANLRMQINYNNANLSFSDYVYQEFEKQNIPKSLQKRLFEAVSAMTEGGDINYDKTLIPKFIQDLYDTMRSIIT
jgi:superfamily I DNA and RNA helicase